MEETLEAIKKRLDVMVHLMIQKKGADSEARSLRDQIELLSSFGLKPKEIAEILSKTGKHVNKELSGIRKIKKSKK